MRRILIWRARLFWRAGSGTPGCGQCRKAVVLTRCCLTRRLPKDLSCRNCCRYPNFGQVHLALEKPSPLGHSVSLSSLLNAETAAAGSPQYVSPCLATCETLSPSWHCETLRIRSPQSCKPGDLWLYAGIVVVSRLS